MLPTKCGLFIPSLLYCLKATSRIIKNCMLKIVDWKISSVCIRRIYVGKYLSHFTVGWFWFYLGQFINIMVEVLVISAMRTWCLSLTSLLWHTFDSLWLDAYSLSCGHFKTMLACVCSYVSAHNLFSLLLYPGFRIPKEQVSDGLDVADGRWGLSTWQSFGQCLFLGGSGGRSY